LADFAFGDYGEELFIDFFVADVFFFFVVVHDNLQKTKTIISPPYGGVTSIK
jgi:hypothetical protein